MTEPERAPSHPAPAAPSETRSPIAEVLALPAYRRYWVSQFLANGVVGSLRLLFVWLVLELTDSAPAAGAVGVALGLPSLVLSLHAGVLSDRVDRLRLVVGALWAIAGLLLVSTVLVTQDWMPVPVLLAIALAIGAAQAISAPAMLAMVPSLVSRERLMSGVALQNIGMMLSQVIGQGIAGGAIAVLGMDGALAALTLTLCASALLMGLVRMAPRVESSGPTASVGDSLRQGLDFGLGTEPLRSLLAVGLVAGTCGGVVTVLLPEISRSQLGQGPFFTGLLLSAMGAGTLVSASAIATRHSIARRGRLCAIVLALVAGPGVILLGVSESYAFTLVCMFGWGIGGGVVITLQRALIQELTSDEMMGRVMGLNSLTMAGAFPLGAGVAAIASAPLGSGSTLITVGTAALLASLLLASRAPLRNA